MNTTNALKKENMPKLFLDFLLEEEKIVLKNIKSADSVLDAGCGNGRIIKILAPRVKHYTGIDIDDECITNAKKAAANYSNTRIEKIDLLKARDAFMEKEFDCALLLWNTLAQFENPAEALLGIMSVSKKVIFSLPMKGSYKERKKYYEQNNIAHTIDYPSETIRSKTWGAVKAFNDSEINSLLLEAKLSPQKIAKFREFEYLIIATKPPALKALKNTPAHTI